MGDITILLAQARAGDRGALDGLFQRLYPDLRRIARARLAPHRRDPMLSTTVLVHECWLKLKAAERVAPADRGQFLAYAASAMRSIIVDIARAARAERRGGDVAHVTLSTAVGEQIAAPEERVLDVEEAVQQLAQLDPRLAQVVEMRWFAGLSDADIAEALGISDRTVRRDWEKARLLLAAALRSP
jgi:RNA polymerase sigma factor (TIGR02999 family)